MDSWLYTYGLSTKMVFVTSIIYMSMTNLEKLNEIFVEVFNTEISALGEDFSRNSVDGWDSVRQLTLTSSIEDSFDIMLDPEDIIGCSSYKEAKDILKKYNIEL